MGTWGCGGDMGVGTRGWGMVGQGGDFWGHGEGDMVGRWGHGGDMRLVNRDMGR